MPGFDQTGPLGQGPMTGGAFGPCSSGDAPDGALRRGLGGGRGRGWGRGLRRRPFLRGATATGIAPSEAGGLQVEVQSLSAEVAALRAALAALKDTDQRLEENVSE